LPAYEAYLASQNKEYTLQQPLKLSQSRKRKRPRRAKAQQELENAPADREIAADEAARDETDGMEVETSSVQNINATPAAVNVQSDSQKTQSSDLGTVVTAPEPTATASTVLGQ